MSSSSLRPIVSRSLGKTHGPITRLISPGELGRRLKPFVFLDFFSANIAPGFGFPMHPHSGIATLTWQPGCDVEYRDTTGQSGILKAGGLEWMNAGRGAWHQGRLLGSGAAIGFQLWVPMPPGVENGAPHGQYIAPADVPSRSIPGGTVTVLLGQLGQDAQSVHSPIVSHQDMNYFVLNLQAGGQWQYESPDLHEVGWAFVFEGTADVQGMSTQRELLIFEGTGGIEVSARSGPMRMLIGTARPHLHPLVTGYSSVHTSVSALAKGEAEIARIGEALRAAGQLG
jgi:redox-sensitive bicupin YhaK (pirin superfamily)